MLLTHIILLLISLLIFYFSKQISSYLKIVDIPNNRKSHLNPVPQTGGIVIFFYCIFLLLNLNFNNFLSAKLIAIWFFLFFSFFIVGFIDDKFNLNAKTKTIIIITILFIALPLDKSLIINSIRLDFLSKPIILNQASLYLTVLFFYFFFNVFNFADGLNGISTSLGIFWLGYLIWHDNGLLNMLHPFLFGLVLFFFLNIFGSIFLGNSGSSIISTLIFLIFLNQYNLTAISFDTLILLFFLPSIDTVRITLQRIFNNQSPFSPDKKHFHHYLNLIIDKKYVFIIYLIIAMLPVLFDNFRINFFINLFINFLLYLFLIYFINKKTK